MIQRWQHRTNQKSGQVRRCLSSGHSASGDREEGRLPVKLVYGVQVDGRHGAEAWAWGPRDRSASPSLDGIKRHPAAVQSSREAADAAAARALEKSRQFIADVLN